MKELKVLEEKSNIKVLNLEKVKNAYKVTFNDGTILSLCEDIVIKFRLVKGKEINKEILKNLDFERKLSNCYNQALKYISSSLKAIKQVRDNLLKHEYDYDIINLVIDKLIENKILDDKIFTKEYVSYLVKQGYGVKMITYKTNILDLKQDIVLDSIDYDLYYDALKKIYLRQSVSYKENKEIKIKKYLIQRGYLLNEIIDIIKEDKYE